MGRPCAHVEPIIERNMDLVSVLKSVRAKRDQAFSVLVHIEDQVDAALVATRISEQHALNLKHDAEKAKQLVYSLDQQEKRIEDRLIAECRALSHHAG